MYVKQNNTLKRKNTLVNLPITACTIDNNLLKYQWKENHTRLCYKFKCIKPYFVIKYDKTTDFYLNSYVLFFDVLGLIIKQPF